MLRTRRFLLALAVLVATVAGPAVAAAPDRTPAPQSFVAWVLDWLGATSSGAAPKAYAAAETYPGADPNGAQAQPQPVGGGDATTQTGDGAGGEAYPSADPNG